MEAISSPNSIFKYEMTSSDNKLTRGNVNTTLSGWEISSIRGLR